MNHGNVQRGGGGGGSTSYFQPLFLSGTILTINIKLGCIRTSVSSTKLQRKFGGRDLSSDKVAPKINVPVDNYGIEELDQLLWG